MNIRQFSVVLVVSLVCVPMMLDGTRAQSSCSSPADCDDGIYCSLDLCDPVTGCSHMPVVGIPCPTGSLCDAGGRCEGFSCAPISPVNCDDFNPCTVDDCDPAIGCTHVGVTCDDGNPCTVDTCTPPGTCTYQPIDCSDGVSCTDDSCDPVTGACQYTENGSCTANPKSLGYWQRVCKGNAHTEDSIRGIDEYCIHLHSCTFRTMTFAEICQVLQRTSPQETCLRARQELLALTLNLCHSRVAPSNGIDSSCADNSSVGEAYAEADAILCEAPDEVTCDLAGCEAREINQGRALHVHALVVQRLAGGSVKLSWIPPVADIDSMASATPQRYRVWRAGVGAGPFVQIAEVANTEYEDSATGGALHVYDVTPIW